MEVREIARHLPEHLRLGEKLGDGGFASVYRVHNSRLQVDWALKVIDVSKLPPDRQAEKILKEARLPAQLRHPNVVTIHDVDEANGFVFMELVDGPALLDIANEGLNSWVEFRDLASGILAGLAEAHRQKIVHGDLSPRNILLTPGKVPKLVDFGFARHVDRSISMVGVTPGYASPEHILMRPVTTQSDVFSAGVVLYRLATGRHPFGWDGKSYDSYSVLVVSEDALPPEFRFPVPSGDIERLLLKALQREQGHRYPTAMEMERAFLNASRREPRREELPTTTPSRQSLKHYERGLEYYHGTTREEMDWAEAEFREALKESPEMALAYVGLADVAIFRYMSYFDRSPVPLAKAEHYCQKALEINPASPEAFRSLGRVHFTRRDFAAAEENLKKALELNPDYLAAHISLAWSFIEAHKLAEAESAAMSAKVLAADHFEVMMTFTRVYYDKKEFERSLSSALNAVSIHRRSGRAYYDLALAQRAVGQFAEARQNFLLSLEFHGDPNARVDLGITEMMDGNLEEARLHFAAAVQETFGFLSSYYLGLTEHRLDNRPAAEAAFRQALEASDRLSKKDPGDPFPRAVGAMAAAGLGDAQRSLTLASMARELDARDGMIAYYTACASTWMDKTAANELLKQAMALPHSPSQIEATSDPHFAR